jgi:6-phosphogluconate dehydrogenase (decarboxylating)
MLSQRRWEGRSVIEGGESLLVGIAAPLRGGGVAGGAVSCRPEPLCPPAGVAELLASLLKFFIEPLDGRVEVGDQVPANANALGELAASAGVEALDAPVSGGRPGAIARELTTLVGGPEAVVRRCEPVLRSFSRHVRRCGETGAGQMAKLFNNALLAMNQAAIADIVALGAAAGLEPADLVEGLKLGSATSAALTLLNTMVTPETVEHLAWVQALDIDLFATALRDAGVQDDKVVGRSRSGPESLPDLVRRLNP